MFHSLYPITYTKYTGVYISTFKEEGGKRKIIQQVGDEANIRAIKEFLVINSSISLLKEMVKTNDRVMINGKHYILFLYKDTIVFQSQTGKLMSGLNIPIGNGTIVFDGDENIIKYLIQLSRDHEAARKLHDEVLDTRRT